ncbi:hypothetical protein G7067_03625 [Leucobacter insecticola]|uniref:DoxX family membrane protein n=1 Tax=Leucobacter insecticola TaxID=2714934 RepID=A0A6G8FLD9_9MICO|nr:hypothetical protein [Leucobacter insecticola]QIM17300.1 hypothetical protein G7067_03625 [Leucobacter insecticola]
MILGAGLVFAGTAHVSFARAEFQAQVPSWVPLDVDVVVVASGIVEIVLGATLVVLPRFRVPLGWIAAAFFLAVFPGNISQFMTGTDAFGLTSDTARGVRLVFQPLLMLWALWSCGSLGALRARREQTVHASSEAP